MDLNTVTAVLTGSAVLDRTGWQDSDAFLAGGTWLFSEPQSTLRRLRDLTTLGWPALTVAEDGLKIAATCTLAELHAFLPPGYWPGATVIRQCCEALLGSFKVWNMATVGGNLCLSLPAGPMATLAAGLDAILTLWAADGSVRFVPAGEFVTGPGRNVLAAGELLREVFLPAAGLSSRAAFRSFSLSSGGRAAGLLLGRVERAGATVLTVSGSTTRPVQVRFPGPPSREQAAAAWRAAHPVWYDDVHGLPRWRRDLTALYLDEVRSELAA